MILKISCKCGAALYFKPDTRDAYNASSAIQCNLQSREFYKAHSACFEYHYPEPQIKSPETIL